MTPEPIDRCRSRALLLPLILVLLGHAVARHLNLHYRLHRAFGNLIDRLVVFLENARLGGSCAAVAFDRLPVEGLQIRQRTRCERRNFFPSSCGFPR